MFVLKRDVKLQLTNFVFTDFSHAFFARDFANYLSHFRISQITITLYYRRASSTAHPYADDSVASVFNLYNS